MSAAHLVDALLALVFAFGLGAGWRRGFVDGVLDLGVLVAALALALVLTPRIEAAWHSARADGRPSLGGWEATVVFVLLLFALRALLGALGGRALRPLPAGARAHRANRWLGLLPSAAHGAINAMLLAVLLLLLPGADALNAAARASPLAQQLTPPAEWIVARLAPVFAPADQALTAMTVEPGGNGSLTLPFTVADPQPRPDLEARMLQMLNTERQAHGVPPLRADPALTAVARAHSLDMFRRGYFSHLSPEHRDPFDRLRAAHLGYLAAGENIAYAPTLDVAERGLMRSPGHRANILRAAFGRVGIGIVDGGVRGLMVTQDFRD